MKSFEWTEASSVGEAQSLLTEGAVYKAGGVDLLDMMKEHLLEPTRLVNLRRIPGLDKITSSQIGFVPSCELGVVALEWNPRPCK